MSFREPINILQWHHVCLSYNANKTVKLVHNGNLEVSHTRPSKVLSLDDYVPSDWFGPSLEGKV